MKIKKFNKILSRLNVLAESVSGSDTISSLEVDLIKKHLLDLYELTLSEDNSVVVATEEKADTFKAKYDEVFDLSTKVSSKPQQAVWQNKTVASPPPPVEEPKEPVVSEPVKVNIEKPAEVVTSESEQQKTVHVEPVPEPIKQYSEPKQETLKVSDISEDHEEIFEQESSNDLSERLSETPIADLTKSMGINERMLTINELFDGDNQSFKKALSDLNNMHSFEQAKNYISLQLIEKYNWVHPKKRKKAKIFIKLVKRRFN